MTRLKIDRMMPLGLPLPPSFVYVSAHSADKVGLVLVQERLKVAASELQKILSAYQTVASSIRNAFHDPLVQVQSVLGEKEHAVRADHVVSLYEYCIKEVKG